jgi:hypothetical protein
MQPAPTVGPLADPQGLPGPRPGFRGSEIFGPWGAASILPLLALPIPVACSPRLVWPRTVDRADGGDAEPLSLLCRQAEDLAEDGCPAALWSAHDAAKQGVALAQRHPWRPILNGTIDALDRAAVGNQRQVVAQGFKDADFADGQGRAVAVPQQSDEFAQADCLDFPGVVSALAAIFKRNLRQEQRFIDPCYILLRFNAGFYLTVIRHITISKHVKVPFQSFIF